MVEKKGNKLLEGTMILATAALTSKFLGFFYKVVLARLIEDSGLGIYEKVYPIYVTILTVSIVGVPVAISKLVSEKKALDKDQLADYIFKIALNFSFVFGLVTTILLILFARPLAEYIIDDPDTYYSILAIAPAVFVVSVMASFRGYFQGQQRMIPTAVSQVVEQFVRIVTLLILAYLLLPFGIEFAAAGAASGAFFGSVAGLIILYFVYFKKEKFKFKLESDNSDFPEVKKVLRQIFNLALPISIGGLVLPVMRLIDMLLISRRLQVAGFSLEEATALFGQFNGMAMTLVRFPTVIAASLAVSLVPAISEANELEANNLVNSRIAKAFKLIAIISIPASAGLFILAEPLCRLIFDNAQAALPLRYLSVGVIAVSLQQMTSSILQGFNKPKLPAINLFFGALVNVILNYTLTAMPSLNIRGAAIATVLGFSVAAILNSYYVFKLAKPKLDYSNLIYKPLVASGIMIVLVYHSHRILLGLNFDILALIFSVLAGIIIYFIVLLLSRVITKKDLLTLPVIGEKLVFILNKLGLVK